MENRNYKLINAGVALGLVVTTAVAARNWENITNYINNRLQLLTSQELILTQEELEEYISPLEHKMNVQSTQIAQLQDIDSELESQIEEYHPPSRMTQDDDCNPSPYPRKRISTDSLNDYSLLSYTIWNAFNKVHSETDFCDKFMCEEGYEFEAVEIYDCPWEIKLLYCKDGCAGGMFSKGLDLPEERVAEIVEEIYD